MSSDKLLSLYRNAFVNSSEAVYVCDDAKHTILSNAAFNRLGNTFKERLLADHPFHVSADTEIVWIDSKMVRRFREDGCFLYLISEGASASSVAEVTLRKLANAIENSQDIYHATAEAIADCLGWRWVAITRFKTPQRLEVLSFLDNVERVEEFEYDIIGTPCALVVESKGFALFSDLLSAFPNYQALHDLGALTYAGLVYKGADNQPLGHIMAMHDVREVDFHLAEEVISIATMALASHFQLHNTQSQLLAVEAKAHEDALTGIGNRHAYEAFLAHVSSTLQSHAPQQWTIAIVDLDRLKPLNDSAGHKAGDQFIQLMATELDKIGRSEDHAFRIGGDEFAVIFPRSSDVFLAALLARFYKAIERVRMTMQFPIDASVGIATTDETSGDVEAWVCLADQRMYQNKRIKRSTCDFA